MATVYDASRLSSGSWVAGTYFEVQRDEQGKDPLRLQGGNELAEAMWRFHRDNPDITSIFIEVKV